MGGRPTLTPAQLSRACKWPLISVILALLVGLVAIAVPIIASVTVAIFVGWVLVVGAITSGFTPSRIEPRGGHSRRC